MENKNIGFGLLPLKKDPNDFSFARTFGSLNLAAIPAFDFEIGKILLIRDQGSDDSCTARAGSVINEDQEDVVLEEGYLYAKEKQIMGDWQGFGADLRTVCKALTKFGQIEKSESPFSFEKDGRDFVANWNNWPVEFDEKAKKHIKDKYFAVDGGYDTFTNIRATLWQNKEEERSVLVGATWRPEWQNAPNGIIPKQYGDFGTPHAFKIFGQKNINGEIYLKAQLSSGTGVGDNGIYYFPAEVVNKEFTFGLFTFRDNISDKDIKIIGEELNLIQRIVKLLMDWWDIIKTGEKPPVVQENPPVVVVDPIEPKKPPEPATTPNPTYLWDTKENIKASIKKIAIEMGIDPELACRVAQCESALNPNAKGINTNKTIDRGLYQFSNYWYKNVSDECAFNPECATRVFCKVVKNGRLKDWNSSKSCWNVV